MGFQGRNFDDRPDEFDSRRSEKIHWAIWLGAGVVILSLVVICLVGGYLLFRQFQSRTSISTPLVVPTSPLATPPISLEPTSTNIPLAPTATLKNPTPLPTPLIGVGQVEATHVGGLPIIDGNLMEWSGFPFYESAFQVYNANSWDGSDDLTAVWRLIWDSNNLYIGVEVIDDTHVQTQRGNQIFRGDSLDMQFDTDRAGDYGNRLNLDDFQIVFSPGDFTELAPSAFLFRGTLEGRILDAPGGNRIKLSAAPTSTGYNLEAVIPWSDLNVSPSTGLVMGLALNVNDNDTPGTAVQEVMKSHVSTRTLTDPTTWGTLILK